jgi:hypothetical protein
VRLPDPHGGAGGGAAQDHPAGCAEQQGEHERGGELAEQAGIGLSAAKSRVQRARGKLRARLEACCAFAFDARGGLLDWEKRQGECTSDGCC